MDGQTDEQMEERMEICTPKLPVLKQVQQQRSLSGCVSLLADLDLYCSYMPEDTFFLGKVLIKTSRIKVIEDPNSSTAIKFRAQLFKANDIVS